jgi:hypothetical protein
MDITYDDEKHSSTKDLGFDSTGQVKPKTIKKSLKIPNE